MTFEEIVEAEAVEFELYIESQSGETNDQDTSNPRTHRGRNGTIRESI